MDQSGLDGRKAVSGELWSQAERFQKVDYWSVRGVAGLGFGRETTGLREASSIRRPRRGDKVTKSRLGGLFLVGFECV